MKYGITLWLMSAGVALAEEPAAQIPAVDPLSSTYLLKLTLGLAFILVLIFAIAWAMKKMHLTPQSNNQLIKIVAAVSVGSRDRIALIEVGDEQILVGLTPGRIEKLHALSTPLSLNAEPSAQQAFSDRFTRLMSRQKHTQDGSHER